MQTDQQGFINTEEGNFRFSCVTERWTIHHSLSQHVRGHFGNPTQIYGNSVARQWPSPPISGAVGADRAAAAAEAASGTAAARPPFISASIPRQLRSQGPAGARPLCLQRCNQRSKMERVSNATAARSHPSSCLLSRSTTPCCRTERRGGTAEADGLQWPRVSGSHLDRLVRSTVEIVLRSHQRSHPVIETCQLLLQFELGTYNVPDLQKAQTRTETRSSLSGTGQWRGCTGQAPARRPGAARPCTASPGPHHLTKGNLVLGLQPGGNGLNALTCR